MSLMELLCISLHHLMLYFLFICHLSISRCKTKWKISRYENIKYNKRRMFTRCNSRDKLIFLNSDVQWCCQYKFSVMMFNSIEYRLRIPCRPSNTQYNISCSFLHSTFRTIRDTFIMNIWNYYPLKGYSFTQ